MRLLIADDDDYTREGLSESFDWHRYGINEILLAEDGEVALRLAASKKPEIVLTDIRMPKLNGIEFAEQLAEKSPDSQLLFMSGYMDVEYLRSAIKLSAVDYIEKPIKMAEVELAVEKTIRSLRHKQEQHVVVNQKNELLRQKLARSLRDEFADPAAVMKMCVEIAFPINRRYLGMIVWNRLEGNVERADLENVLSFWLENGVKVIGEQLDPGQCFIILAYDRQDHKRITFLNNLFIKRHNSYNVAIGKGAGMLSELPASFRTAQRAVARSFYYPDVRCFYNQEEIEIFNESLSHVLPEFYKICANTPQKLPDWIRTSCAAFKEKEFPPKERVAALFETVIQDTVGSDPKLLYTLESDYGIEDVNQYLHDCRTIGRLEQLMLDVCAVWLDATLKVNQYSKLVQDVIYYIAVNYRNVDLDLRMIADHMHLSTAHLGVLFKQETGTTIKQYINDYRMELAKQLVTSGHLKMNTIAELCGYASASYFAKVFKASTDFSPIEYRKKN